MEFLLCLLFWFLLWMCDGILVWFCSIQQLCCYSHYIQYHSWANYFFLYLLLALIPHLLMLWCFLFLSPETLFNCIFIEVGVSSFLTLGTVFFATIIPCFPSPPDFLYEFFHHNIPSLLNSHLNLPNYTQSISHKLCHSRIQGQVHHPLHFAPHLDIVEVCIPPLPCKIGQFWTLLWCSVFSGEFLLYGSPPCVVYDNFDHDTQSVGAYWNSNAWSISAYMHISFLFLKMGACC